MGKAAASKFSIHEYYISKRYERNIGLRHRFQNKDRSQVIYLCVLYHASKYNFNIRVKKCNYGMRFVLYRYKEKHSSSREMKSRLLPNSLKQNIIIRQLKPCSDYSMRIRLSTPEKDTIFLMLDDFRTGPSNKITSLDVGNITDKSAVVTWNPKENGVQCASSFRIKGSVHSFDVNPAKVLTTWKSLESCRQYIVNIFPKFGEKVGQSTTITFTTFPSPKFFDAWVDESRHLIFWQPNEKWELCKDSVTSIQYVFKVIKCSLDKPQFTHIISLDQSCTVSLECFINIDDLKKQIADKLDIEEGSY